ASAHARARLQWTAWSVVVAGAVSAAVWALNQLVSWPESVVPVVVACTALVPVSIALASTEGIAVRVDRLLVHTITVAGLLGMLPGVFLLVVIGLGRSPASSERWVLGLSMVAAALAALLWVPVRERVHDFATRQVYGERHAPDEVLRTFGSRL